MQSSSESNRRRGLRAKSAQGVIAARAVLAPLGLALLLAVSQVGCANDEDKLAEVASLLEEQETSRAIEILRELSAKDPGNPEYHFTIGVALLQDGRPSEAVFPLMRASESEAFGVQAGLVLASTLLDAQNFEESITAVQRVLAREPENGAALAVLANAAAGLRDGALTVEAADRLIALEPENPSWRHVRAAGLADQGETDAARKIFVELMNAPAPEIDPLSPARACTALAKMDTDAKDEDAAVARLVECEERFGEQPLARAAIAAIYRELERGDDAIALAQRALERNPEDEGARTALANLLVRADRFEEAEQLIAEAVGEGNAASWDSLAQIRMDKGDPSGALEAIDKVLELRPEPTAEQLFRKTDILLWLGRLDEAEAMLPTLADEPIYADIVRARLLQERGEPAAALEIYDRVLGNWPHNYNLRVHAAVAAISVDDFERAESELLEATRHAAGETDAALWLARLHFAQGDYRAATQMAVRHIDERGSATPDAHLLAVRAYLRNGQPQAATRALSALANVREGLFAGWALAEAATIATQREGAEAGLAGLRSSLEQRELDLGSEAGEPALAKLLELLVANDRLDEAASTIDGLIAANPDRAALHAMAGRLAVIRGNADAASPRFAKALELDPENAAALAGQALASSAAGDAKEAARLAEQAFAISGAADYGYMAARIRLDAGDEAGAARLFDEVIRRHPDHAATANDFAFLLADDPASLERATRLAELANRLAPGPEVADTLAYVLLRSGKADQAEQLLRSALTKAPDYSTAHYHLALALKEKGQPEEARDALRLALARPFPEEERARDLLAELEGSTGATP